MSTSQQLTVYKNYPTEITIKANGYNDYKTTKTFTTAGETVNIPSTEMTAYDGLDCSFSTASNNLYLADFSDTTLPNGNTPSPTLYAMKASGQTYPIPSTPVYDNYTIVGSPTVNTSTGVATGFSLNNYLQLPEPFNPGNNPWEMRVKFSSDDISYPQPVFHSTPRMFTNSGFYGIVLDIWEGKFVLAISNNGTSWLLNQPGTYTPQSNTVYWVKFGWTGTEYYIDYSTDGTNYTRDLTYTSSTPAYQNNTASVFGLFTWDTTQGRYLHGSLYLEDCYIKVNNSIWWEANSSSDVQVEGCLVNYTDNGSAVTLNAYQTGNKIILTPDVSYEGIKLGTVNVPEHTVSGE